MAEAAAPGGLLAGFDAGQTHTTCRLQSLEGGQTLAQGDGGGVCHLAAEGGAERFSEALASSLAAARANLPGPWAGVPLLAAAIGASGIERGTTVQRQGRELAAAALGLPLERLAVDGDERTALRGAFPDGPGIVVISGTGTIAVGRDGRGGEHRCAGWGWLLDGAGSACDIGRDGLALGLRMADGRMADGPLRSALWQALALDPADPGAAQRLKALVVQPDFGPAGFARLAPLVAAAAGGGDAEAAAILRRNAEALATMASGVAHALGLEAPAVCGMGGALTHLGELRRCFASALQTALPGARLVEPRGDACSGALAIAAGLA
jgi:phenylacetic acid degradation operon negative regulatory protein